MSRQQKLFDLILSMSISEKTFFKKYSNRYSLKSNQYLKLFDAIKKQQTYDEEKLLKKLKNEPFVKHFAVTKNYLYQAVLQSLEAYYRDYIPKAQLFQYHNQIQVLIHKCLYTQAEQLLKKTKVLALKEEYYDILCQLNYLEMTLLVESEKTAIIIKESTKLRAEYEDYAQKFKSQYDFIHLSAQFLILLRNRQQISSSEEYQTLIATIKQHSLMQSPPSFGTFFDKTRYCNFKALLSIFDKDFQAAHDFLKTYLKLFEAYPKQIVYKPLNYLVAFQNLINNCRRLKKYEEYEMLVKKMRQIPDKYKLKDKESVLPLIFIRSYALEFGLYYETKRYDKLEKSVADIEAFLSKNQHKVEKIWLTIIAYGLAEFYFDRKNNTAKSISWLNVILNAPEKNIDIFYVLPARLLQICIYLHLHQEQFVEHKIQEAKTFIKKYEVDIPFVKIFLNHLKKVNFSINKTTRKKALENLENTYLKYQKSNTSTYAPWLEICTIFLDKEKGKEF